MITPINLVLCAYHEVGLRVLAHALSRDDINDIFVFTHELAQGVPDIAAFASEHRLHCSIENINKATLPFQPDIIASVYYRHILSKEIIDSCNGKAFNLHPSLLPRHRGCSSVPWAIFDGDVMSGITFHYITTAVDRGKVILQASVPISKQETQDSLYYRCMEKGVRFWPAAFELVKAGFTGVEQDQEEMSSYHRRGAPNNGQIDDQWPEERIDRFIRAMILRNRPPAMYNGKPVHTIQEYRSIREKKEFNN